MASDGIDSQEYVPDDICMIKQDGRHKTAVLRKHTSGYGKQLLQKGSKRGMRRSWDQKQQAELLHSN